MSYCTAVDESTSQRIILRLDEALARRVAAALEAAMDPDLIQVAASVSALIRPTFQVVVYNGSTGQWSDPLSVSGQVHAFLKSHVGPLVAQRFIQRVLEECTTTEQVTRLAMEYANLVPMQATGAEDEDIRSWFK